MPTITISESTAAELRALAGAPAGLSATAKSDLLAALGGVVPPVVPPIVVPPVVVPPVSPTGMPIALPAHGNRDYHVNLAPGATISAWFVMPDIFQQLNLGFMYNSGASNFRTFVLRINGVEVKKTVAKSIMHTLGPSSIAVAAGATVELQVSNTYKGQAMGQPGNSSGFFQIQRG